MDERTLNIFRKHPDSYVSGEDISRELGISRTAVWKHIEDLRRAGYVIEALPHLGYRFVRGPDRLLAEEIRHGLNTRIIGKKILSFDTVDSTMDIAYDLAARTEAEGACVFAEAQSRGRGRMGRKWQSPGHKGMYVSIILRPGILPNETPRITLTAAVSAAKAIRAKTGLPALIKWPNDILIGNKKACGILTEMNAESDRVRFVVVGVGVNINTKRSELVNTATSLKEALGEAIDRVAFARAFLEQMDKNYLLLTHKGFRPILNEWRGLSATLGRRVKADFNNRRIEGQAMDVDDSGALLVRMDNGFTERISSGDVVMER